ncbi:MAG: hypothetical protein WDM87_17690 [Terracidiphilus sp.]
MEQLLETEPAEANGSSRISIWKNPPSWLLEKKLSRGFWVFFAVAFFFDFGFSVYVFLFNLYLLDFHFNERDHRPSSAAQQHWGRSSERCRPMDCSQDGAASAADNFASSRRHCWE